ncbi:MAG: efflux transporter periplasmic adaptor subunit [Verrucomicrobia bacterium A1]|nr:MAG: efflux transporter periplasmic adaptor subunit [Verrucomicrobia bacterium A1]
MTEPAIQSQESIARTLGLDESGNNKRRLKRRMWWGVAVAATVLVVVTLCSRYSNSKSVRYETRPVRRGDLVVTVSATGTLEPVKQVDVGIEVSGTIKTVEVDYNDEVKVGQVLARIDTSKLEAQALQSEAALESVRARLLQAKASVKEAEAKWARLKRLSELSGGKTPSQNDLDVAEATLARAKADEASAKASVAQTQASFDVTLTELSKAVIRSSINGIVLKRSVEPGQTVAAAFQSPVLFTLAENLAQLELRADVDEADVGQVQKGQDATFTVDAYPDETFPARITKVRFGSQTVDGVVTYKTILKVDNSNGNLRPGMTATAVISVKKVKDALLVPNAALRFSPPQQQQIVEPNGSLVSKLLPHPPGSSQKPSEQTGEKSKEQLVWTLRNGQLTPVTIIKGVTDGVVTEVLGGAVEPGMELVTDMGSIK